VFAAAGPTLWNSLPHDITDYVSLTSVCRKLKTFLLFSVSFPLLQTTLKSSDVCMYVSQVYTMVVVIYSCKLLCLAYVIGVRSTSCDSRT